MIIKNNHWSVLCSLLFSSTSMFNLFFTFLHYSRLTEALDCIFTAISSGKMINIFRSNNQTEARRGHQWNVLRLDAGGPDGPQNIRLLQARRRAADEP